MRIVLIGKRERGGGMIAAPRLHRGLQQQGHQSTLFLLEREEEDYDPTIRRFSASRDLLSRIRRRAGALRIARDYARYRSSRPRGAEHFSDDRAPYGGDVLQQIPPCDVVNIHFMNGFLDYQAVLGPLARRTPIVRTLHDMEFFTGGCHVDGGCGRFVDRCGVCPQLGSRAFNDLSHQIWLRKDAALRSVPAGRLWLVTPSQWLAAEVGRSSLAGRFPLAVIPHGVDTEVFRPRDRAAARDVLGIPPDARVLLFVSDYMHRPTKGFAVLAEALNGLTHDPRLVLLSVGSGRPATEVRIPHVKLNSVRNDSLMSLVYSAADVLVVPSLQETFSLAALEAMACGIPVVGSAVGGIREVVRPGVTGLLVPPKDVAALREAIQQLLGDPARRAEMSAHGRQLAVEEYPLALHVRRYVELYDAIRSDRAPAPAPPAPEPARALLC